MTSSYGAMAPSADCTRLNATRVGAVSIASGSRPAQRHDAHPHPTVPAAPARGTELAVNSTSGTTTVAPAGEGGGDRAEQLPRPGTAHRDVEPTGTPTRPDEGHRRPVGGLLPRLVRGTPPPAIGQRSPAPPSQTGLGWKPVAGGVSTNPGSGCHSVRTSLQLHATALATGPAPRTSQRQSTPPVAPAAPRHERGAVGGPGEAPASRDDPVRGGLTGCSRLMIHILTNPEMVIPVPVGFTFRRHSRSRIGDLRPAR